MKRAKLVIEHPDGRTSTCVLPYSVAWAAARGIAKDTYCAVTLHGRYGIATFGGNGRGQVVWNEHSTTPYAVTAFGENTTVCI